MYERPGRAYYATATKAVKANDPVTEDGIVGAAVKTKARAWSDGYNTTTYTQIAVSEKFTIRTKGVHEFAVGSGTPGVLIAAAPKGTAIYIHAADNTLNIEPGAAIGDLPFGRIVEVAADNRGVGTGFVRIDLDQKDTIIPAV